MARVRALLKEGVDVTPAKAGEVQALALAAFENAAQAVFPADDESALKVLEHARACFTGRELPADALRTLTGGYEDIGDIARMAQKAQSDLGRGLLDAAGRDRLLQFIADAAELLEASRLLGLTVFLPGPGEADPPALYRALASFFAEAVNDHRFEYRPWMFSRGTGFSHLSGEALYREAVMRFEALDAYVRGLLARLHEIRALAVDERRALLGDPLFAEQGPSVGSGFPALGPEQGFERRWRAFGQVRELAFMRNDGFPVPEVFPDFDPALIEADRRANLVLLFPVGRTHVSRALAEGPALDRELKAEGHPGANLLITRDGEVTRLAGYGRDVLVVHDAHLHLSRDEFAAALVKHRGLGLPRARERADQVTGPKGVRAAVRFTRPVVAALAAPFHGHPKYDSGLLEGLGLPYATQSLFHTWTTYDKAKYPAIFHPGTGVDLPAEIDWLASETARLGPDRARRAIREGDRSRKFPGLRAFAARYPLVVVKDAAESGGRGQKAFALVGEDGRRNEQVLREAVEFTLQISLKHNVVLQEAVLSSPETWATEAFLDLFVDRQIADWGAAVDRRRRPRTPLYGSHRLIFSSPDPRGGVWHVSHPITLNSRQLITNVGRGGTLEVFYKEFIRPEFRETLSQRLMEAGQRAMRALGDFEAASAGAFRSGTGREVGRDATGLSYGAARYMMLDFLVTPVFAEKGRLVDVEPLVDPEGRRTGTRFVLQDGERRLDGTVQDWRVVLIEPNIGIGLWDRVALRELYWAVERVKLPDWDRVGENARIVLRDFAQAAIAYLEAVRIKE